MHRAVCAHTCWTLKWTSCSAALHDGWQLPIQCPCYSATHPYIGRRDILASEQALHCKQWASTPLGTWPCWAVGGLLAYLQCTSCSIALFLYGALPTCSISLVQHQKQAFHAHLLPGMCLMAAMRCQAQESATYVWQHHTVTVDKVVARLMPRPSAVA